jgi:AraC-like DNA-binding protein
MSDDRHHYELVRQRPAEALRGLVDDYVGYALSDPPPGVHRGLPSRHLTLVLTLDGPLEMATMPDPTQQPGRFDMLLSGLHTRPAGIRMAGAQTGIQLAVSPSGVRALFGHPAGALRSSVVGLGDVIGPDAERLVDQLRHATSWRSRFHLLEQALIRRLDAAPPPARPEVAWAWRRLVRTRGGATVTSIAAEVGWSRRHLSSQFDAEVGLTPKVAGRVVRFEHTVAALKAAPTTGLAAVAYANGYADQAHMTREWRELAGCPPSVWLREEYPYLRIAEAQDGTSVPG